MAGFFERLANMIDEEVSKAGANGNTASVPAAAPKKPAAPKAASAKVAAPKVAKKTTVGKKM